MEMIFVEGVESDDDFIVQKQDEVIIVLGKLYLIVGCEIKQFWELVEEEFVVGCLVRFFLKYRWEKRVQI